MHNKTVIKNGSVLLADGLKATDVAMSKGTISRVAYDILADESDTVIDAKGKYVLPGMIDIHTNGIAGFDLTLGVYDPAEDSFRSSEEAYLHGLDIALRKYAATGVTRAFLTSLASPVAELRRVFRNVSKYRNNSRGQSWGGVLAGLNIEGTFIKDAAYRGAHNPDYFNGPSRELFEELQVAADGIITIVNVVPEWGRSALDLIEYLTGRDIVCAAGHTGATGNQYAEAVRSGTRLAVHFPNGPTGSSVKPFDGGGAIESVLRADEVFVEIIADGYHVDKSYVMDIIRRKGFDKVVVVTDSMFPTLLEVPAGFSMLGVEGKVSANGEYLQVVGGGNALFGSTLTMDKAFSNILDWLTAPIEGVWYKRHEPLGFEEALLLASEMCSRNPATVVGIFEPKSGDAGKDLSSYTGSIEPGKSADVVIADIEEIGGKHHLKVERVFVKGEMV